MSIIDRIRILLACAILPPVWARCLKFQIEAENILNGQYEGEIASEIGKLLVECNREIRRVK